MSIWRQGFTKVVLKSGSSLSLHQDQFHLIYDHWQRGMTFGLYKGIYGHTCAIKFAEVACIVLSTSESIVLEEQDNDEDARIEKSKELTGDG